MRLGIGISGASGVIYGIRALELLHRQPQVETHLIVSQAGRMNVAIETDWKLGDVEALASHVYAIGDLAAPIASGSSGLDGMLVTPCSMKTLSSIVNCYADNLLVRAADVVLKENRPLVLMPRESPLHVGHCRLLHQAAEMGILIAPPLPAFYNKPKTVDDIVNHSVGRALDLFGLDVGVVKRWKAVDA